MFDMIEVACRCQYTETKISLRCCQTKIDSTLSKVGFYLDKTKKLLCCQHTMLQIVDGKPKTTNFQHKIRRKVSMKGVI